MNAFLNEKLRVFLSIEGFPTEILNGIFKYEFNNFDRDYYLFWRINKGFRFEHWKLRPLTDKNYCVCQKTILLKERSYAQIASKLSQWFRDYAKLRGI
jgi:hypothetical protein